MRSPIRHRGHIPFYVDKTATDLRNDPYEQYDPSVIRQCKLHLMDEVWSGYPLQEVQSYIRRHIPTTPQTILEVGCGVSRIISDLAISYPSAQCYGIDYSYQMLKMAYDVHIAGKGVKIDVSSHGLGNQVTLDTRSLDNLQLGLAQCQDLPLGDGSQDVVLSTFLLDRLDDPMVGMKEMKRVLRDGGKIIVVTPLNFNSKQNWKDYYPSDKLKSKIEKVGLDVLDWKEGIEVEEPMDRRGNKIVWNCVGLVIGK